MVNVPYTPRLPSQSQWEVARHRAKLFMLGSLGGMCASIAVTVGVMAGQYGEHERLTNSIVDLRLSERKTSTMTPDVRKTVFTGIVVPKYNLQPDSLDYKVLETACLTGVYGSNVNDFKVPAERVKSTYELCGWKIGQ